jgi:alkylation response protein AidB-like acyl-CoA dehydrogenase
MDFRFNEEQDALRGLAREIFENEVTPERLKAVEASGGGVDDELWLRLGEANLLGLAIPENQGGMGMGFIELCLLLHEMGRAVAPVPLLPALVGAALPLAQFGSPSQQDRWLSPLAKGEIFLSASASDGPALKATPKGEGFALSGLCRSVPAVHRAKRLLLPAADGDEEFLALVDPEATGLDTSRSLTSRKEPVFDLQLEGVALGPEDVLRGPGIMDWAHQHCLVATAATQVGVSERALEITTAYLGEREQFGAPLASLTAVQHRCADAYIGLDAMRWMTWTAAARLGEGRSAAREAWAAKFWAADAGSRISNAMQHLHGGIGVDMDYPIHRYFFWSKALELASGGGTVQLLELGRDMARTGPEEFE